MRNNLCIIVMGVIGIGMIFNGCAKRVKPEPAMEVQEERVASTPEFGESMPEEEFPGIRESDVEMEGTDRRDTTIEEIEFEREESPFERGEGGLQVILFDFDKFNIRHN